MICLERKKFAVHSIGSALGESSMVKTFFSASAHMYAFGGAIY